MPPSSSADAHSHSHSQPRRPPAMARQHSSTSHMSQQSPPDASHHHAPKQPKPRQHVVGGGRMQRNTSTGKNLNKLSKLTHAHPHPHPPADGHASAKHHRRAHSGNSTSAPSSPRPSFKRNASSGGIVRVANQAANIRKNHSSGHLARHAHAHAHAKPALKSSKSEIAPPRRSLAHPGRARSPSPEHPTVHFDVGDDDDGQDDGWTEESASQSPNTTRSNTRSNSMVLDPHRMAEQRHSTTAAGGNGAAAAGGAVAQAVAQAESSTQSQQQQQQQQQQPPQNQTQAHPPPPSIPSHTLPDRTHPSRQSNGSNGTSHSRPPDADIITSRLLQRSSHQNAPPQMSSVAATVVSNYSEVRELSQSGGSTLVDTPGRDLVSRFIDGDGSAGTSGNNSFIPSRNSPKPGSGADRIKHNKSMPNVAGAGAGTPSPAPSSPTPTKTQHRRSGTGTSIGTPTDLPPSRTQQKLMLQRASSNIEPQKLIPVILPRTGGPSFLHSAGAGITYTANSEGRLDPRLQQQFNHVAVEYSVVRRYRNPLADAIKRIEQIPGGTPARKAAASSRGSSRRTSSATNGHVRNGSGGGLSASFGDEAAEGQRRGGEGNDDADAEGTQSFESGDTSRSAAAASGRIIRNEVEEICRRLWESTEAVDVEGD